MVLLYLKLSIKNIPYTNMKLQPDWNVGSSDCKSVICYLDSVLYFLKLSMCFKNQDSLCTAENADFSPTPT